MLLPAKLFFPADYSALLRPPFTPIFHQKRIPDTFFKFFYKNFLSTAVYDPLRAGRISPDTGQCPAKGGSVMVKGTTRQVLVVRPQESDLFEQAIFLLREEALEQHGVTEQALLEEARRLAAAPPSARPHRRHPGFPVRRDGSGICGAGVALLRADLLRQHRILALTESCGTAPGLLRPLKKTNGQSCFFSRFMVQYGAGGMDPCSCFPAIRRFSSHRWPA